MSTRAFTATNEEEILKNYIQKEKKCQDSLKATTSSSIHSVQCGFFSSQMIDSVLQVTYELLGDFGTVSNASFLFQSALAKAKACHVLAIYAIVQCNAQGS